MSECQNGYLTYCKIFFSRKITQERTKFTPSDKINKRRQNERNWKRTYRLKYKDKTIAHAKIENLRMQSDFRSSDFICAICGQNPVELHLENYELWYVFIPLCYKHHRETYTGGQK